MAEVMYTPSGVSLEVAARALSTVDLFLTLDEVVHQRTRLAVLCVLRWRGELDFNTLRDELALSDGNLARHVTVLRAADLVETTKRTEGRRRRTYITATEQGAAALDAHVDAMANIVNVHQSVCSLQLAEHAG